MRISKAGEDEGCEYGPIVGILQQLILSLVEALSYGKKIPTVVSMKTPINHWTWHLHFLNLCKRHANVEEEKETIDLTMRKR